MDGLYSNDWTKIYKSLNDGINLGDYGSFLCLASYILLTALISLKVQKINQEKLSCKASHSKIEFIPDFVISCDCRYQYKREVLYGYAKLRENLEMRMHYSNPALIVIFRLLHFCEELSRITEHERWWLCEFDPYIDQFIHAISHLGSLIISRPY
ncbi:hypothetical protein MKW98_003157, partial [Papaver atlanticum]